MVSGGFLMGSGVFKRWVVVGGVRKKSNYLAFQVREGVVEVSEMEKPPPSHILSKGGGEGVRSEETPSISHFEKGRGWWRYQGWGNPSISCFEPGRGGGGVETPSISHFE